MDIYAVSSQSPEMEDVWRLAHDVYVQEGYCKPQPDGLLIHHPELDGIWETTVIIARERGRIIGTNSITIDSNRLLHIEEIFPKQVAFVREECKQQQVRLASSWRIVTSPQSRSKTRLLLEIIWATFRIIHQVCGAEVALYTFHPKHVGFYTRVVGMTALAGPCDDPSVSGAPAVLMLSNRLRAEPYLREIRRRLTQRRLESKQ